MSRHDDIDLLHTAVKEAAALALDWFKRKPTGRQKEDGSGPVSDADLAVDAFLRERLMTARPEYGWLSEESAPSPDRCTRRRVWLVDPIDGTSAFLAGNDTFTISAALIEDSQPVLAALAAPASDEIYCAEKGAGATLNGEQVTPKPRTQTLEGSVLLGQQGVIDLLAPAQSGPFSGSIVHRVCEAALGRVDGALTTSPLHEWDVGGAQLFAEELGLTVTDANGSALTYNNPETEVAGLICASAELSSAILAKLEKPI